MRFPLVLAAAVWVLMFSPAFAQDFQRGWLAHKAGEPEAAYMEWEPLAQEGHAAAQNNLGLMFLRGYGVPQDFDTARDWFRRAAEQGDTFAQNNLGFMYLEGTGVPADPVMALKWFEVAALQGDEAGDTNRLEVAQNLSQRDIDRARSLAWDWVYNSG